MDEKMDRRNALRVARQSLQAALALLDVVEGDEQRESAEHVRHDRTPLGKRKTLDAIRAGELPASQVGRHYFVKSGDLAAYLERRRVTGRARAPKVANDHAAETVDDVLAEVGLVEVRAPRRAGAR